MYSNLTRLAALAGGLAMTACGISQSNEESSAAAPRTSATYVLSQGHAVALGPKVDVRLERVNDSRCRKGAVCVWQGYISYTFTLTSHGKSSNFVLSEDMPNGRSSLVHQGLRFTLGPVEPAEPPAPHAALPAYRVSLKVDIA